MVRWLPLVAVVFVIYVFEINASEPKIGCLTGPKHKEKPTPEDKTYVACHAYMNRSCCTADFTRQFLQSPITKVDDTYWNLCGNLSQKCESFMTDIECFYRCSPLSINWENPNYPSSFLRVPVCGEFCDAWFEACKDDMTCAEGGDWITGFHWSDSRENSCKANNSCTTWKEVYGDGKGLCEKQWGKSFEYGSDKDKCLQLRFEEGQQNNNEAVVKKIFGSKVTGGSTRIGFSLFVFGVVLGPSGLFLL